MDSQYHAIDVGWLVGWLVVCLSFMSNRQRGHLETAPWMYCK